MNSNLMNELPNDSCWDLERDGFEVFRDVFHASNLVRSAAAERTGNEFKDVFGSEDSEGGQEMAKTSPNRRIF